MTNAKCHKPQATSHKPQATSMSHRRSQKHTNKHTSNVREAWTHATRLGAAPHGTQRRSDEEQHARSVPDEQSLGWVDADAAAEQVPAQAER
mgnify:CR=1 FL=1